MLNKLESVEKRYDELLQKLSDPTIIADNRLYQKLGRERAELTCVVEAFRKYKKIQADIDGNKEIIESAQDEDLTAIAKEELAVLSEQLSREEENLKLLLLPKDPNDDKNTILEIRAGTGGEEAALFAAELFRMYQRFAESKGWKIEIMNENPTGLGGLKEVIALVSGDRVFSQLKYESGVHRVQRVPATEASGRVHTSAVTVVVLPEADDIDINIEEKDLRIDVYRASGPGGQGVNRTDSAVRVTHIPTGMVVACQDSRSQHKNKAHALKVLKTRMLDHEMKKNEAERSAAVKSMVGSGDRSEKIRTYNFPQNRFTDHRIGLTIHNLMQILEGELGEVIVALRTHYQAEALKSSRD